MSFTERTLLIYWRRTFKITNTVLPYNVTGINTKKEWIGFFFVERKMNLRKKKSPFWIQIIIFLQTWTFLLLSQIILYTAIWWILHWYYLLTPKRMTYVVFFNRGVIQHFFLLKVLCRHKIKFERINKIVPYLLY